MSTRIYNGFVFRDTDFRAIDRRLRSFQKWVRPQHRQKVASFIATTATNLFDDYHTHDLRGVTKSQEVNSPYWHAYDLLEKEQKKLKESSFRSPRVDFGFEVWMFFHKDAFFGIINTEQADWRKHWFDQKWVSEFRYWNNTDKPDHLSERGWRARGRIWEAILGPDGIPATNCWTRQLTKEVELVFPINDQGLLQATIPSTKERIDRIARDVLFYRWKHDVTAENVVQMLFLFQDYLKTDDGRAAMETTRAEVAPRISNITMDDLLKELA